VLYSPGTAGVFHLLGEAFQSLAGKVAAANLPVGVEEGTVFRRVGRRY